MQQLKSISPQWEAKGGKLRPVNPYENSFNPYKATDLGGIQYTEELLCEFDKFEETAKLHEYDTNAPDGIYNAEELEDVVWQAYNEESRSWEDIFPANYEICEAIDKGFKEYKADALKLFNMETRQFVPGLKQQ